VECFGSFRYKIMLSVNRNSFISTLPVCIPSISFFCLITLAWNSKIMLNKNGASGHPCVAPDFRGNGFRSNKIIAIS
jgi:hypothetical protein